jgi:hypothetical protein
MSVKVLEVFKKNKKAQFFILISYVLLVLGISATARAF